MSKFVSLVLGGSENRTSIYFRIIPPSEVITTGNKRGLEFWDSYSDDEVILLLKQILRSFFSDVTFSDPGHGESLVARTEGTLDRNELLNRISAEMIQMHLQPPPNHGLM